MKLKDFEPNGYVISVDSYATKYKDDAIQLSEMPNGNYCVTLYIANPCVDIDVTDILKEDIGDKTCFLNSNPKNKKVKECGLSEYEEKDAIYYKLEINSNGNMIDFDFGKCKVQIDIAFIDEEISDLLEKDDKLSNYILEFFLLGDAIYNKRTGKEDIKRYDEFNNVPFGVYLANEVTSLVNCVLAKKFYDEKIPCIYDVKELDKSGYDRYNYIYTSKPTNSMKYGCLYGAFTSPLRSVADLKNVQILNDVFFKNYDNDEEKNLIIEKHRKDIKDYVSYRTDLYNEGMKNEYIRI